MKIYSIVEATLRNDCSCVVTECTYVDILLKQPTALIKVFRSSYFS